MQEIRTHLINDTEFINLLGGQYLWLLEKPIKVITNTYICYNFKELSKDILTNYQVEFGIISKDLDKALLIKEKLIELLDNERNNIRIQGIKQTLLLNGGGILKHQDTGNYEIIVYFYVIK